MYLLLPNLPLMCMLRITYTTATPSITISEGNAGGSGGNAVQQVEKSNAGRKE